MPLFLYHSDKIGLWEQYAVLRINTQLSTHFCFASQRVWTYRPKIWTYFKVTKLPEQFSQTTSELNSECFTCCVHERDEIRTFRWLLVALAGSRGHDVVQGHQVGSRGGRGGDATDHGGCVVVVNVQFLNRCHDNLSNEKS